MYNINMTCGEIESAGGFEHRVHADLLNHTNNPDCDQSWYSQDGRLIADPSDPQKLIDPVISVSSDRLVTSYCVDELHHEIICHSDELRYDTTFRAFNDSISGSTQTAESNHFWWLLAVFIIALLIIILICLMKRKRIFRCFQRLIFQRDSDDSENRLYHLVSEGYEDVNVCVFLTQAAAQLSSEIQTDSGFEFNLPSDSLNQTLNPDCEQSWYLQSHFSREIMFRVRNQTAVTPNSDDLNEASLQHSVQLNLIDVI
ncbi:hypothetical protein ROHU_016246 [Labeo rohita]|uniref:Uncharacterized protein n=1 Tax=Labeo rohita TaxID=84645 RepID=A0A498NKQ2_LABRO|nr:hypothetical protein ROHU_016246 [Labeo rohita]